MDVKVEKYHQKGLKILIELKNKDNGTNKRKEIKNKNNNRKIKRIKKPSNKWKKTMWIINKSELINLMKQKYMLCPQ